MALGDRSPRVWIDVEQGATFGSPAASVEMLQELSGALGPLTEAWLFCRDSAPLVRGFYYPTSVHRRLGIPRDRGPQMVLIDEQGDQLWLSGVSCGTGRSAAGALTVLNALGFAVPDLAAGQESPLAGRDEMHFVDQRLATFRPIDQPVPASPPGKTFVRGGRLVNRMEFDKGSANAQDLQGLWAMATEPHAWLGLPTALTLYQSKGRSDESGHDGCQLIVEGESGRELWLQLPEPDDYDRLAPGRRREHYEGAFTEYEAVKRAIFHSVGIEIDPPDGRPWRQRLLGRHPAPPEVISWP